jgi:hypothetical protein
MRLPVRSAAEPLLDSLGVLRVVVTLGTQRRKITS